MRTARERALLAALVLLILLGSVASLAAWSAGSDRDARSSLEHRATAVAALERARAQFFMSANLFAASVYVEDPGASFDLYGQAQARTEEALDEARGALVAAGEPEAVAAVDRFVEQVGQLRREGNAFMAAVLAAEPDARVEIGRQYQPRVWPVAAATVGELGQLAEEQQTALASARAAADRAADTSLGLVIGFSAFAFLAGAATLVTVGLSVVRPLSSLRASVREIKLGNLGARAKVFGPEEVASLARDFNEMVAERRRTEETLAHRLKVETAVAQASNMLVGAEDLDAGLNAALRMLGEAVGTNRSYIFMLRDDKRTLDNTHEWCAPGTEPQIDKLQGLDCELSPWWMDRLRGNEAVVVPDVSKMPAEAKAERKRLEAQDIRSLLVVPLNVGGELAGAIGFDDTGGPRLWQEEDVTLLRLAGESVSAFFTRKRVEETLRVSEERLRAVVTNAPVILFAIDGEGVVTLSEGKGLESLGLRPGQNVGRSIFEVYREAPQVIEHLRRALAGETSTTTGELGGVIFEARYTPIQDRDGRITGAIGVATDITEWKQAEGALRQSEAKFRRIFENVQDIFYQTDANGIITEISPPVERYGYTREGLIGTQVLDVYESPEQRAALLQAILEHGEVVDFEIRLKTGDGRVIDTSVSSHFIRGSDGTRIGVEGTLRDISERKRVEKELRESEERYRDLFDNANDILYTHDLAGRFTSLNKVGEQVTGYTRDEALKMDIAQITAPDHLARAREMMRRKVAGRGATTYELEIVAKDGRSVPLEVSTRLIYDDGKPVGVQGIARDISERKRTEEALREQVRRDPLTGVLNHAAIVEELRGLITGGGDNSPCAVAMIDVDGLKAINDTYGHQVGDGVLMAVAEALPKNGARVGRYGGDEFVVVLPGADRDAAERYREEVLGALARARLTDPESGASVPVVVSVGLAIYPMEAGRIEELIRLADSEMYAARRQRPAGSATGALPRPLGSDRAAKMVGEIVPLLTSPGGLNEKLRLVAHRLSIAAGYDAVNFALFTAELGPPTMQDTFARVPEEYLEAWNREQRRARDVPLRNMMERARRPIILDDLLRDERLTHMQRKLVRKAGLHSALIAPMIWQNELIGMLSVASKGKAAFGPPDAQFLAAVATQVTAIVRMSTLVEDLQSASVRLTEAQAETMMLLAAAAEAHDRTTGFHLQNVRAITEALGQELGYSEEGAKGLGLAAVLHDIGKIRVPDSLLASVGRLSNEEWGLMKQHTVWGEEFLAARPGFELAAAIARSHHEHWDGSGYPDGLSSEAIPEPATIVGVADAFDAMTSDRPYRPRRSVAQAMREILEYSGKQFSPKVVDGLARLHKQRMLHRLHRHELPKQAA